MLTKLVAREIIRNKGAQGQKYQVKEILTSYRAGPDSPCNSSFRLISEHVAHAFQGFDKSFAQLFA